jgi:hypothetical protein
VANTSNGGEAALEGAAHKHTAQAHDTVNTRRSRLGMSISDFSCDESAGTDWEGSNKARGVLAKHSCASKHNGSPQQQQSAVLPLARENGISSFNPEPTATAWVTVGGMPKLSPLAPVKRANTTATSTSYSVPDGFHRLRKAVRSSPRSPAS